MDITEDQRLDELRQALKHLPKSEDQTPKASTGSQVDLSGWDINAISALTTLDLSALTTSQITAYPAPNASVQLGGLGGNASATTIYTIGGGSGGGSGGYHYGTGTGYTYPNTATWSGPGKVKITADEIELSGKNLGKTLERIELMLGILDTNADLEKDWDELRELGEKYRAMQQKIEDKLKTFETLKK